jgi:hypothetical protein
MFNLFKKKDIELIPGSLWHMENHYNEFMIFPTYDLKTEEATEKPLVKCFPYSTIIMYLKIGYGEAKWVVPGSVKYAICLIDNNLVAINYDWFTSHMVPLKEYPVHKRV